jgi:hypothetical protein
MFRIVPPVRNLPPGYEITYPNRDKAESKAMKGAVVVLLLVSVGLMAIITIGGWSKLEGQQPLNFVFMFLYLVFAYFIARWQRGVLPIAAAISILLLIMVTIAGTGLTGTSWFDRNKSGFASAGSLFGGGGLSPDLLGLLVLLLIPVQILLIVFSMRAFSQGWNVEVEVPADQRHRGGAAPVAA